MQEIDCILYYFLLPQFNKFEVIEINIRERKFQKT